MTTPGSFDEVQIWTPFEMSTGSSKEPPLMLGLSSSWPVWFHKRVPQSLQKAPTPVAPLSRIHSNVFGAPFVTFSEGPFAETDIPKAEADCAWQFVQWQTLMSSRSTSHE
jgi:hypothetical protein